MWCNWLFTFPLESFPLPVFFYDWANRLWLLSLSYFVANISRWVFTFKIPEWNQVESRRNANKKKLQYLFWHDDCHLFVMDGRLHIMPDFSACPLMSDEDVNNWLHFYHASAPLINLSVFISHDPVITKRFHSISLSLFPWLYGSLFRLTVATDSTTHPSWKGLDLRVEHTHCFSIHGEGGHYHEDVTPETVVYSGDYKKNVVEGMRNNSLNVRVKASVLFDVSLFGMRFFFHVEKHKESVCHYGKKRSGWKSFLPSPCTMSPSTMVIKK